MPPQTRRKTVKSSKENVPPAKSKITHKVTKQRKALADKTNSASDDNLSTEIVKKNKSLTASSPYKTPQKKSDSSIIVNRPKRVCRLPSKFNDHSMSPNKFIPVGCHASTPIVQNKKTYIPPKGALSDKITPVKEAKQNNLQNKRSPQKKTNAITPAKTVTEPLFVKVCIVKDTTQNKLCYNNIPKKTNVITAAEVISDTNNNAQQRKLRQRNVRNKNDFPLSPEKEHLSKKKHKGKKILQKSFSFRVLEDKPAKRDSSHLDVYEFTYDPNEEPPPQKKKRKKTVRKNPTKVTKPKVVTFKNNYDQNVSKALAALKNVVSKKTSESQVKEQIKGLNKQQLPIVPTTIQPPIPTVTVRSTVAEKPAGVTVPENVPQKPANNMSTRVEDIEADFEPLMDHDDINYSPVTSPNHGKSPVRTDVTLQRHTNNHDPLNLQDNLSFFDDIPVASSSMNTSVRRPHASPWRVQFQQLPIKWHVNTYVKPNMTPAVESSFVNFNESNKKKHVYTNLVPESNDVLPEIVSNDRPNLKQTSIISFYREVVERSAGKKKRAVSVTPTKANSVFEDLSAMSVATNKDVYKTPNKTPNRVETNNYWTPNEIQEENVFEPVSEDKENSGSSEKKVKTQQTSKSTNKEKDGTFFGFDESEDQENVSPVKIDNPRVRALRPRARAVLQEINAQSGPTRVMVPLAAKTNTIANSDAINKVYEGMKSATDAPAFSERNTNKDDTNINVEHQANLEDEDSQSIHLFEDIEIVHHAKPSRKSYGKAKKVAFQQTAASDSDSTSLDPPLQKNNVGESSDEDDLADLTFTLPNVAAKNIAKTKATKKKKQQSKKEKAEMEAWAAQFNSMCEDVEEFPLLVE
ncbi:hypothetical protein evm_008064 [Chilo suppressalis]|nr:hypothetical protein evm_008064 [Chilo suppressalis]